MSHCARMTADFHWRSKTIISKMCGETAKKMCTPEKSQQIGVHLVSWRDSCVNHTDCNYWIDTATAKTDLNTVME